MIDQPPQSPANSTSYCLHSLTADGQRPQFRFIAMRGLPFGSKVRLLGPRRKTFFGLRHFYVHDRPDAYTELDFWTPSCSTATAWGRRSVSFEVVR